MRTLIIAFCFLAATSPLYATAAGATAPDAAGPFRELFSSFSALIAPLFSSSQSIDDASFLRLNSQQQASYFSALADRDPDGAWKYLIHLFRTHDVPGINGHVFAHIVGKALYMRYGMAAMAHCSYDFGFGCFHGIVMAAINERGEAAASALANECEKIFPVGNNSSGIGMVHVCVHGIGHGIASAEALDVTRSIARCEALPKGPSVTVSNIDDGTADNHSACLEGAFMEIAFDTPVFSDPANAWRFCSSMPSAYQASCARYVPMTPSRDGAPAVRTLPEAIALCAKAPNSTERDGCLNESTLLTVGFLDPSIIRLRDSDTATLPMYLVRACTNGTTNAAYLKRCIEVSAGYVILSAAIKPDGGLQISPSMAISYARMICDTLDSRSAASCLIRSEFVARAFSSP